MEYSVITREKVQMKKCECRNEVDWKIVDTSLAYERFVQEFNNSGEGADGTYFQRFVFSAPQEWGEGRMTKV